mmetsp:Transcript_57256/g.147717  ORF Transcript_57256/g.147717 Transcript_57256/m.147717 type:complete len:207 (+) Transcript_57256:550-1170(+)
MREIDAQRRHLLGQAGRQSKQVFVPRAGGPELQAEALQVRRQTRHQESQATAVLPCQTDLQGFPCDVRTQGLGKLLTHRVAEIWQRRKLPKCRREEGSQSLGCLLVACMIGQGGGFQRPAGNAVQDPLAVHFDRCLCLNHIDGEGGLQHAQREAALPGGLRPAASARALLLHTLLLLCQPMRQHLGPERTGAGEDREVQRGGGLVQ